MILAATGHRPDKLGGYSSELELALLGLAAEYLGKNRPEKVISGMALGWDMAIARAAILAGIPLIAAVPFAGQQAKWPEAARGAYRAMIESAHQTIIVSEGGYANWKFQKRNEWMVDRCDHMVALWDGTPGGTANCIGYAQAVGRHYDNLWDRWRGQ